MSKTNGNSKGSPSPQRAQIGREVAARLDANPNVRRAKVDLAQIYTYPDFFSDADCDMLMALIDSNARPSTLLAATDDPDYRTSHSSDLYRWSPEIQAIDDRIADLLGIPPENAETMQGQRYAPNQQFRAHCDYFHEGSGYWDKMLEMAASVPGRRWPISTMSRKAAPPGSRAPVSASSRSGACW